MTAPNVVCVDWTIRKSLLDYVRERGMLSRSPLNLWQESRFVFVARTSRLDGARMRAEFGGEILMRAHGGALRVLLKDPSLDWDTISGVGAMSFETGPLGRLPFADLSWPDARDDVSEEHTDQGITLHANLTPSGAALFGGFYPVGEPLDDLVLSGVNLNHNLRNQDRLPQL